MDYINPRGRKSSAGHQIVPLFVWLNISNKLRTCLLPICLILSLLSFTIIFEDSHRLDLWGGGTITNTWVGKHVSEQTGFWKAAWFYQQKESKNQSQSILYCISKSFCLWNSTEKKHQQEVVCCHCRDEQTERPCLLIGLTNSQLIWGYFNFGKKFS